jgi:hypothetical protein
LNRRGSDSEKSTTTRRGGYRLLSGAKRWLHSQRARRVFAGILGWLGFLLNGLCLFAFSSVFWYDSGQGQPHMFLVTIFLGGVLPFSLAVSGFGILLHRKSILSWTGLVMGGLIVLFFVLAQIFVVFISPFVFSSE